MCKKLIYLVSFVFVLGSVSNAEDIQWTDLGADHLWSTPENWDLGRVPTLADDVRIDVPAAGAPNGPVIQDGIDAKAKGIFNEAPGEPTLTMTGGTLEVAEWIWWGDGADSFGIWDMSGGTVDVANEFELGWDGGAGTLIMTGGTINAGEAVIPTGSGAFGELFLNGGTYNVTKPGGLSVKENGLIDITEGTLVLEGDETAKVNDLVAAGLITAYGGASQIELDFDGRNPGKTTVTAQQADMEIGFATQPPVIDGEVDGIWADASTQYIVPQGDPADASGSWKALYDSVNLYVIVDINDDSLVNDTASSWQDDSVEFYFDGGNTKDGPPLSGDNRQYTFGWTTDDVQGTNTQIEGVEHAQVDTDTGWRIEIKLPWLSLQDTEPQAGDLIGIDCFYNDDDDGGDSREGQIFTFATDGSAWNDASQWGTAILTAIPVPAAEGPKIIWVGDAHDLANPGGPPDDQGWVDLLEANGYIVDYQKNVPGTGPWQGDLSDEQIQALNSADLVIISRDASTGGHNRPDAWNSIEAPVLSLNNYMARSSRWQWVNSTAINARQSYYDLKADDPEHPIFAGVELDPNGQVVWFDPAAGSGYAGFFDANDVGNGYLIASRPDNGNLLIVEWEAGVPFYEGTDQVPAGKRMLFCAGNQEIGGTNEFFGTYNLSAEGEKMFLNAVKYMIPVKPVDPGTDGLVAFYALENDVLDGSGNGNDGTIVGNPTYVEGPAGYGMAMEFDGESYVDCGNDASLDITGPISMSIWIRPGTDGSVETAPLCKADASAGWSWQLRYGWGSGGKPTIMGFQFNATGGSVWIFVNQDLAIGEWYHIAASHDGATVKCYLDGVETDSAPMTDFAGGPSTLLIGSDGWRSDWIGAIDEVAIYNRDLSDGEIRYLAGERAVDPSLVIYYSFDEVSDIVADQSGKGHDGVVVGDVTAEPEGMYNGAANFASGSYLDLDGPSFPAEDIPTSAMTLAAWIKCANTGGDHEIFSARASDNTWLVHPEPKSSGDIRWLLRSYGGTTIFQIRAGTMTWDEWLHFAGTYDKASGKAALYINGELIEEVDVVSPADIAGDWDLGARVGYTIDNARPFTGLMDEFRMYTRALTQDEIQEIMQGM